MRTLPQRHCNKTVDHNAHTVWSPVPLAPEFRCPGRHTPSRYAAPKPSPAQPSDPFAGIGESTEYDATRPGVS